MFVDSALIRVRAGKGGDGVVSFYRGRGLPKGGPDGGDGGRGANIFLHADPGLNTLIDFRGVRDWHADNGEPGRGKQQFGAAADDMTIRIPPGTLVYNDATGELMADVGPDETVPIAKGGKGGHGNEHFKSSTNQTPRKATSGQLGEEFALRLELKLIAEVGLVGLPNAGKSTLLKALTRADPKIADYPFTTLSPQLGIAELDPTRRVVLADIPGLIEGAADGAGLGHDFLRHVERTSVILHLLDCCPPDGSHPADNYRTIRAELAGYSPELAEKPEMIVLSKTDLLLDEDARLEAVSALCSELRLGAQESLLTISSASGSGLNELLERLWVLLHGVDAEVEGWKPA